MIGVAVVGFGVIGRRHASAYQRAREAGLPCQLLTICSKHGSKAIGEGPIGNLAALGGGDALDPEIRLTGEVDQVLSDPAITAVSICTWTETHVDLAVRALAAGKHVLVEKPVAIRAERIVPLLRAVDQSPNLCVPAMVMRWWPGWPWLREQVQAGRYGAVRSAVFQRVGSRPDWALFYAQYDRSGGALIDLHVHDADFLRWCFGQPAEVVSEGNLSRVTSLYRYPGGPPHVTAEGGWTLARAVPFRMRYWVEFEEAVADFDVSRDPSVLLTHGGETNPVPLPEGNPYDLEVRDFIAGIRDGKRELRATIRDAFETARLLDAERESLETGAAASPRGGPVGTDV